MPYGLPHSPVFYLLLATVFWSFSFVWTKDAIEVVNVQCGLAADSSFGILVVLGVRFLCAALVWGLVFWKFWFGWTGPAYSRTLLAGFLFWAGLLLQGFCLAWTTDAISAFLTSLSVLFIPLIMAYAPAIMTAMGCPRLSQSLPAMVWTAVMLAVPGILLMSYAPGAISAGPLFLPGFLCGIACAMVFSLHIFVVNDAVNRFGAIKLTGGQFLAVVLFCLPTALLFYGVSVWDLLHAITHPEVLWRMVLLVLIPGVMAFGLANFFQPKVAPYRAALIYLLEPILASLIAFMFAGRGLSWPQLAGAGLILVANAMCEYAEYRVRSAERKQSYPVSTPAV